MDVRSAYSRDVEQYLQRVKEKGPTFQASVDFAKRFGRLVISLPIV